MPSVAGPLPNAVRRPRWRLAATFEPDKRAEMLAVVIRLPDRVLTVDETIDLGDRTVTVRHHGRGHTEGDVVVEVDGTGVCFGGDLIEESGPPWFGDGFPIAWPDTVQRLAGGSSHGLRARPRRRDDGDGSAAQLAELVPSPAWPPSRTPPVSPSMPST